ncbi:MAG TPA: Smr/MutS family protein [Thiobacillus sp.]
MKRGRGTALGAVSLEALARFRRTVIAEAAAQSAARPGPPPSPPIDGPAAFRLAVADVTPLPPPNRAEMPRQRPKAIARHARNEQSIMVDSLSDPWEMDASVSANEALAFVRSGVPTATLKKIRRGRWAIRGELDLHGHTGDEARVALAAFLNRCKLEDRRCVRIIHGKGYGSKNRLPVLKNKVRHWLMQREDVLAFCQAPTNDGGAGAVIVLLKSSNR